MKLKTAVILVLTYTNVATGQMAELLISGSRASTQTSSLLLTKCELNPHGSIKKKSCGGEGATNLKLVDINQTVILSPGTYHISDQGNYYFFELRADEKKVIELIQFDAPADAQNGEIWVNIDYRQIPMKNNLLQAMFTRYDSIHWQLKMKEECLKPANQIACEAYWNAQKPEDLDNILIKFNPDGSLYHWNFFRAEYNLITPFDLPKSYAERGESLGLIPGAYSLLFKDRNGQWRRQ